MKPRADFVCLNRACAANEENVYELPVDATHCPAGHKRLRRLFNKVGVIGTRALGPEPDWRLTRTDHSRTDTIMRASYDQFLETKVQDHNIRAMEAGDREMEINMPGGKKFIRPSREEVARTFGLGGKALTAQDVNPDVAQRARNLFARQARTDPATVPHILNRADHRRSLERSTGELYGFKGVKD